MSYFGSYSASEILKKEFKTRKFLIENIIRENDSVLLIGGEKSGKSILAKQLVASLSAGHQPFLNEYEVRRACKVTYIQIEGELVDTKERMERMFKIVDCEPDNIQVIFSEPLNLRDKQKAFELIQQIEKFHKPDVLVIDPLYFAFSGKMSDDDIVREFLGNLRVIKDHFGCALILVHHTHRIKFDHKGNQIKEGDEAMFGSASLKWWPDHIILFIRDKKTELRYFSCQTQRSGDIVKELTLKLNEPDPLFFSKADEQFGLSGKSSSICLLLAKSGQAMRPKEICEELGINKSTFYHSIDKLIKEGLITKIGQNKEVRYVYESKVQ